MHASGLGLYLHVHSHFTACCSSSTTTIISRFLAWQLAITSSLPSPFHQDCSLFVLHRSIYPSPMHLSRRISKTTVSGTIRSGFSSHVVIMGPPGGGKGTISKKMLKDFPFDHISTGDLLRAHIRDKTDIGVRVKDIMEKGGLVSDELVLELLMHRSKESSKSLLLDGFPRTVNQAKLLSESPIKISAVIALNIPHSVIVERISNRWVHAPSGRTYAYDYNPPKQHGMDDLTGEPLVQRPDDTPHAVQERLDKYESLTSPLVEYYKSLGIAHVFSGTESNVIYPHVKEFCEKTLKFE